VLEIIQRARGDTYFMEHGGVAVTDAQQVKFHDPVEWKREFFEPAKPNVHRHVSILFSDEPSGGGRWCHTRGLRKGGTGPIGSFGPLREGHGNREIGHCNRETGHWNREVSHGK
jgi:hypothetical protein